MNNYKERLNLEKETTELKINESNEKIKSKESGIQKINTECAQIETDLETIDTKMPEYDKHYFFNWIASIVLYIEIVVLTISSSIHFVSDGHFGMYWLRGVVGAIIASAMVSCLHPWLDKLINKKYFDGWNPDKLIKSKEKELKKLKSERKDLESELALESQRNEELKTIYNLIEALDDKVENNNLTSIPDLVETEIKEDTYIEEYNETLENLENNIPTNTIDLVETELKEETPNEEYSEDKPKIRVRKIDN